MCKKKIIFFITKYLRTPPVSFVNSLAIPPKVRSHFCANHKLSVQKIRLCEHRLIFVLKVCTFKKFVVPLQLFLQI